jgi:BASS family bile acid:Na+ symporter
MNPFMQFCQSIFSPVVIVFTISNLLMMGLQVRIPQVVSKAKNIKFLILLLIWGWVIGPALAYLINMILPLAEPFKQVMLLTSLAPCAPFLPGMISRAKGDIDFAGAFIPLAALGTVIFMPLLAPLMIKGLAISSMALAKPLVITVLIPLVIGALIRTYASSVADKSFKPVKLLANLSTLATIILCFIIYTPNMIKTAGSFALAALTIFMVVIALITYFFGFGLKQTERSVMSLGMGTRNIAAALAGVLSIPNADSRMVTMVIIWTLWSIILAFILSPLYGRKAVKAGSGGES